MSLLTFPDAFSGASLDLSPRQSSPRSSSGDLQRQVRMAREYPFDRPAGDFVFNARTGDVEPLDAVAAEAWLARAETRALVPVLAVGSNASPEQLRRKFCTTEASYGMIPVFACTVKGYDSVYSAHVASYGSITATLRESQGAVLHTHLTLLDEVQLQRMHATEGTAYRYVAITDGHVRLEINSEEVPKVFTYIQRHGALRIEGQPVALEAVRCAGRRFRAMGQEEVLRRVLPDGDGLDERILSIVGNKRLRQRLNRDLALVADSDMVGVDAKPLAASAPREKVSQLPGLTPLPLVA